MSEQEHKNAEDNNPQPAQEQQPVFESTNEYKSLEERAVDEILDELKEERLKNAEGQHLHADPSVLAPSEEKLPAYSNDLDALLGKVDTVFEKLEHGQEAKVESRDDNSFAQEEPIPNPDYRNSTGRELTQGEKLVGITFNPGGNPKVNELKALAARMVDILEEDQQQSLYSPLGLELRSAARIAILQAQMMAVKVVTLQY